MQKQIEQMLDSREVAEMVGKNHADLMRDIRRYTEQLTESKIAVGAFFQEGTYQDINNQKRPCFMVTKKGCEFISHKLTGIKGTEFTARYINKFHAMQQVVSRNDFMQEMSPQLQILFNMELEQKRQAKELEQVKENQQVITQALSKPIEQDFRSWVNSSLSMIADSYNYPYIGNSQQRHIAVRSESYDKLNQKRPCRLNQRVERAKEDAARAGATKAQQNAINKLTIIEMDRDLKLVYESVIREMLIAYNVNANSYMAMEV